MLILACPDMPEEDLTLDLIKPLWEALEEMVEKRVVLSLGIADLQKPKLEELFNWAKVSAKIQ